MTLNHYGFVFPPYSNMYAVASVCNSTHHDKKILINDCYKQEAKMLAKNLVTLAKLLKSSKDYSWDYSGKAD